MEALDYKFELWFYKQIDMLYDKYANDKKVAKQRIASLKRCGDILLRFGLYVADMSSDVALLIFVGSAFFTVHSLLPQELDEGFSVGVLSGIAANVNNLTSDYNKTKEMKDQIETHCNVTNIELDKNLDFLDNILRKYAQQLGIVLAVSLVAQASWSYINFDFMHDKNYPCGKFGKFCCQICSVILCPFLMFYSICQTDLILHDSKREHCSQSSESEDENRDAKEDSDNNTCDTENGSEDNICDAEEGPEDNMFDTEEGIVSETPLIKKDFKGQNYMTYEDMKYFMLYRYRYGGKINEAFIESQATLRVQVGYYLAFSFVASLPQWNNVDCIAKAVIGSELHIFKFETYSWHGLPILAVSAITSVLSITMAQYSMYQSKHEFDMAILGKVLYFLGSLGAVIAKLSAQVIFVMSLNAWAMSKDLNPNLELLLIVLPHLSIHVFHNIKDLFINFKTTKPHEKSGPYLSIKFLTTTARKYTLQRWRFSEHDGPKPAKTNFMRKINEFIHKWNARPCLRDEHWSWNCLIIFPGGHLQRPIFHPDVYGFDQYPKSRKRFQGRFVLSIGKAFLKKHRSIHIKKKSLSKKHKSNLL